MSEENLEIARQGYDAYNREGPYAIIEYLDPEIEWGTPEQDPFMTGTYSGHEGVRRFLDQFFELFEEARIEPEEFIETGDRVVVPFQFTARTRESGIEVSERWAHVWTIRAGKAVRLDQYTDPDKALNAAGLSE
jgi:ketosteroid isomerase-like protein